MSTVKEIIMEIQSDESTNAPAPKQVCGFRVGQDYFAVPVLEVQEVIRPQKVTPVPLAGETIRGLINLRGQIVTSISLRTLFKLDEDLSADHMNVIVKFKNSLYALVVDEILDVITPGAETFESTPDTIKEHLKGYLKGVYKLNDRLLTLLDLDKVLAS